MPAQVDDEPPGRGLRLTGAATAGAATAGAAGASVRYPVGIPPARPGGYSTPPVPRAHLVPHSRIVGLGILRPFSIFLCLIIGILHLTGL